MTTTDSDLVGLHARELSADEIERRDALLEGDDTAIADQALADWLAEDLPGLLDVDGGPSALDVRVAASSRGGRSWLAIGALLAAAVLIWVLLPTPETQRPRGAGVDAQVALSAVAEGPRGRRALAAGSSVAADERVVFFISTSSSGTLEIIEVSGEGSSVLHPSLAAWRVEAGEHVPGGDEPLSYRPDTPLTEAIYRARLCRQPDDCGVSEFPLRWAQ